MTDIEEFKDEDLEKMKDFYHTILSETKFFIPYLHNLNGGRFNDPDRLKYVIKNKYIIAHLTLVKINEDNYSMGIAVLKEYSNIGLGKQLIGFGLNKIRQLGGKIALITIYAENWKSVILFSKFGFKFTEEDGVLRGEKVL